MTQPNPQFTDPRDAFHSIEDGLARLADGWKSTLEELYDHLANYELTPEAQRGIVTKLKEAHQADRTTYAESYAATYAEGKVREARLDEALKYPQPLYEQGFQDGAREALEGLKTSNLMEDEQPKYRHDDKFHSCCAERLNKHGGNAKCCFCVPHTHK